MQDKEIRRWDYYKVPAHVLKVKNLIPHEKLILMVIGSFRKSANGCYARNSTLAEATGMSPKTVSTHISNLEKKGVLTIKRNTTRSREIYLNGIYKDIFTTMDIFKVMGGELAYNEEHALSCGTGQSTPSGGKTSCGTGHLSCGTGYPYNIKDDNINNKSTGNVCISADESSCSPTTDDLPDGTVSADAPTPPPNNEITTKQQKRKLTFELIGEIREYWNGLKNLRKSPEMHNPDKEHRWFYNSAYAASQNEKFILKWRELLDWMDGQECAGLYSYANFFKRDWFDEQLFKMEQDPKKKDSWEEFDRVKAIQDKLRMEDVD